jgi:hypothetical protein
MMVGAEWRTGRQNDEGRKEGKEGRKEEENWTKQGRRKIGVEREVSYSNTESTERYAPAMDGVRRAREGGFGNLMRKSEEGRRDRGDRWTGGWGSARVGGPGETGI